jgi:predicted nucleic acid-binding Zn finger protein
MKDDKWVKRWVVPSSSGEGEYIVGQDAEGNYGCSCPGWTRHMYCPKCGSGVKKDDTYCACCGQVFDGLKPVRKDCRHILDVKAGRAQTLAEATLDKMKGREAIRKATLPNAFLK